MNYLRYIFLFTFFGGHVFTFCQTNWVELPLIPDQEGYAGMFSGVSHDVLICAGGANFPDNRPWEGGAKKWYDHIYFLEGIDNQWNISEKKLPRPLAYGISVSYEDQVIMVGGSDALQHYADVVVLEYIDGEIQINKGLPSLPMPISNMSGALVDGVIYLAGGNSAPTEVAGKHFYVLDLKKDKSDLRWEKGPAWPGPARIQSVAASHDGNFYMFSGFELKANSKGDLDRFLLKDAFRYGPGRSDAATGVWTQLPEMPRGVAAAPSPAFTQGMAHIIIPGGLDSMTITYHDQATHPGFREEVTAFNVHSNSWVTMDPMPKGSSRVTAPTVQWQKKWLVINGEKGPGVRSPKIYALESGVEFGWINWVTLMVYLALMLWMGFYFSRRGISTDDYFLGGGRIPWWAAGISIYGTQLSAITFMAVPALVFATDWRLAIGTMMILGIVPIIVRYYLPFYRKMNITTAYEFLEARYNFNVRALGSLTFILLQLGRMGVVLYLPAIAISSVTGIDIILCIAVMGVFATFYTVLGGIEAVIWTDVIQVVVLMGGAIACIFVAISNIDGGVSEVISVGAEYDKFRLLDWRFDYTELVFWVAIFGFFFLNLISYTSDQVIIQRYLTVKSEKDAARSLWTNGIITLPGIFIFFGLGTTLFVYYFTNPGEISSNKPDEILPYFVVAKLPVGVAGLVISGIFAASMSSLDSSMNSIATAYITDFHKHFWPGSEDKTYLRIAKYVTILMGAFGTGTAIWIATANVEFIFDFFQEILGIIGGSLGGVFALAVFTKRANSRGAVVGIIAGAIVTVLIKNFTDVNGYLFGAIGVVTCFAVGWLASVPIKVQKRAM